MIEREIANVLVKHGAEQLHTHHDSATEDLLVHKLIKKQTFQHQNHELYWIYKHGTLFALLISASVTHSTTQ
uniref:hypothetical protein n=1 Tax=Vibrio cholerae TaxID=666 RepID=UPI003F58DFA3